MVPSPFNPSSHRQPTTRILPLILMLLLGFLLARWLPRWWRPERDLNAVPRPVVPRGDLADDEKSTVELFQNNSPSVVFITTETVEYNLFARAQTSQGAGSGFVWDQQGHIVTNDHVIAEASEARVILADKTGWSATIVGRAPSSDLAVLSIDAPAESLKPLGLGRSSDLQVGQKVFAIGSPFGLDHTLTTGVISALERQLPTEGSDLAPGLKRTIEGVIQTDAAINPGNSGGPLLDSAGRLIGVNTAIFSPSGAYAGVGFAIPVDTVNRIVPQLIRHGRVIRPSIGIIPFGDSITENLEPSGVLIYGVIPGSAAADAGLRPTRPRTFQRRSRRDMPFLFGDLIISADGQRIANLDDWFTFLEAHQVGETVQLTIVRDLGMSSQAQMTVTVTLEEERLR
jgi:S1-C subfamily serine protease